MGFTRGFEKTAKPKKHYHGSPHRFDMLRTGSWVTPHAEDAEVFGAPWSSHEIIQDTKHGRGGGRPPFRLEFKPGVEVPADHPVYVYEVEGETKPAETNSGSKYAWNRKVTKDTPIKLVKTIPSWHEHLLHR